MNLIIRQARLDDRHAIQEFIDNNYAQGAQKRAHYKNPDWWEWQYIKNPYKNERAEFLPIWLAIADGRIVGQVCAIPTKAKVGDSYYDLGWGCDFIVNKEFRGLGIGWKVHKAYAEQFQIAGGLSMSSSTRHILNKFPSVSLGPVHVYFYPVKMKASLADGMILRKLKGRPNWHWLYETLYKYYRINYLASFSGNIFLSMRRLFRPLPKRDGTLCIQEISCFDREIDEFAERTSKAYGAIVKRESRFLNWKFVSGPRFIYRKFVIRKDKELRGYIVVRRPHEAEGNVAHIVDFYAAHDDAEAIRELMLFAIGLFGNSVSAIQCAASTICVQNVLRSLGFIRTETIHPLLLVLDATIRAEVKRTSDDWHLTLADQDLERIWDYDRGLGK